MKILTVNVAWAQFKFLILKWTLIRFLGDFGVDSDVGKFAIWIS